MKFKPTEENNHPGHNGQSHFEQVGPWDPKIQNSIHKLIEQISPGQPFEHSDVVTEIMVTALKAVQSQITRGDLKLLSRSIRELRYAFKIFKSYRGIRKVTIFGSARTKPSHPAYKSAKLFASKLAKNGYMVITGAGPGIMMAGNEGAGPAASFGVNIRLPYEQHPNKFIADQPTYIDCRYFFTRKLIFVKEASGAVFFPGGFGTLDEAFEILTLVQTGKCEPIPIILVDVPGGAFWKSFKKFIAGHLLSAKRISKEDMSIFKIVTSPQAACDELFKFYSNYHSQRYVGDRLVMRLQNPVDEKQLAYLNKNYTNLLESGRFEAGSALKEEDNQPELQHLPRLIFKFNRVNNGRLRQLIDYLNS